MSKEGGGWVKGDSGESFYCSGTINNYGSSSTYPSGSDDQNSGSNNVSNSVSLSNFSGGNVSSGYSTSGISYKGIIEKTSNPQNGSLLLGEKVINISNSNLKNEDVGVLVQYLQYQQLNLNKFDASNNQLGYGAVESLFYTFSLARSHTALYNIKYINISHNFIGDDGAKYIASHLSAGQHPNLKAIDLSDNQITSTGYGYIAASVNKAPNDNLGVIMETHKSGSGVWNFIKQAFNYYAKELAQKTQVNDKAVLAIYGQDDWAPCKKLITDMSKDMSVGFVKYSSNALVSQALQKSPPQLKGGVVAAVFITSATDAALNVNVENLAYCLSAINNHMGLGISHGVEVIGNNGEIEYGW